MSDFQKRSISQVSSTSSRINGVFVPKPPTSPLSQNQQRERVFSPPVHHRAFQPQLSTGQSSSFTSFSSLNIQESIHHLLPKPPLSVTNKINAVQNSISNQNQDYQKGNIVQQIHQKLIQQRNLPAQLKGTNINPTFSTKIENGGVQLVNNMRSASPIITRRVQNLSNSIIHNNSGNNLNQSISHNNSIDVIVNNPQENMQYDIILNNEKEYLKNQVRGINEQQIFMNNSQLVIHKFATSPPKTVRISARSETNQSSIPNLIQNHQLQQVSPPIHAIITSPPQNQVYQAPKLLNSSLPQGLFIKQTQINGIPTDLQTQKNQGVKQTITNLSESAMKLLDTYKRQKEILFEQIPVSVVPQTQVNYQTNNQIVTSIQTQIKNQINSIPTNSNSNIPSTALNNPTTQSIIPHTNYSINQQLNGKNSQTLKDSSSIIKNQDVFHSLEERQRSSSQNGGVNIQTSSQASIHYSSMPPKQVPPGSCAIAKITSRPVTSIEEKNLIEEYKQKNYIRRNSFSSQTHSTGCKLQTVVEAPFEQSMRLSSLLINTSAFNHSKNSVYHSKDISLEEDSIKKQQTILPQFPQCEEEQIKKSEQFNIQIENKLQYTTNQNLLKDLNLYNQINTVDHFNQYQINIPTNKENIYADKQNIMQIQQIQNIKTEQKNIGLSITEEEEEENQYEIAQSNQVFLTEREQNIKQIHSNNKKEDNDSYETEDNNHGSPKVQNKNQLKVSESLRDTKYRDAQTSPIKIIDAKPSSGVINSLITDTNLFESKTLIESQFIITENSTLAVQQNYQEPQKLTQRLSTRNSERIIPKNSSDEQQEQIDEDYMKNRKKEIQKQIKDKKLQKKHINNSKTPRGDSTFKQKPATPNNKFNKTQEKLNGSPKTKRDSRISLESANNNYNLKQSKASLEGSVIESQSQSVASYQQQALQKRDEILDKIKHIDEQIILHQKFQNQQRDEDLSNLKSQNKMILVNNQELQQNIQNSTHNRSSHISQKSNATIDDTPIKKVKSSKTAISSSINNIQLPISSQQIPPKAERSSIKRSESNSSLRRQGSNRKIEGFIVQSSETQQQINLSNGHSATPPITSKGSSQANSTNTSSNNFLNNFKETFVNKSSKIPDFGKDMTQAQKQLMNKQYNSKKYNQYQNPVSQPSTNRSVNSINKKDLKISNGLDKSQESKGACLSSTNKNKFNINNDFILGKRSENDTHYNLTRQRQNNNQNIKENITMPQSEPLGVINLFEISKNKKRDSSLLNRNQSREDLLPNSPQSNHYFRVSDKLKEFEMREINLDNRKVTQQSKNNNYNSKGTIIDHSVADYESISSAKFNSVLQEMSNYHADAKNIGFTIIPQTQQIYKEQNFIQYKELDLEAEHLKRQMKQNKNCDENNSNPYLLKKIEDISFQGGKQQNVQIKGNKYQFSFDKKLEQVDERMPSCSFTNKCNDEEFAYDCSPIPQRNKVEEDLSDISSIQNNYLQEQQEQQMQTYSKQIKY